MIAKLNRVHMSKKNQAKLHGALCNLIDVMQELDFKHTTKITCVRGLAVFKSTFSKDICKITVQI
jgi:hypothetical protein